MKLLNLSKHLIGIAGLVLSVTVWADDQDIAQLFKTAGVQGTLVIANLDGDQSYVHNSNRAKQAFWPASTFKIPNTLIALDAGVIHQADDVIKWDGTKKRLKSWSQDQTLASAFARSCLWCYQEFAKQIGDASYRKYLQKMTYGNQQTGNEVTQFWLEGKLAITAWQQIDFLRRLYRQQLPFKAEHFATLKDIMLVETTANYSLYAKTGWAVRPDGQHGWYVGYVERQSEVWLFALNMDIYSNQDAKNRVLLARQALHAKGII